MIFILQEKVGGRWWHVSFHIQRYYAEEQLNYMKESFGATEFRIREFKIPQEV